MQLARSFWNSFVAQKKTLLWGVLFLVGICILILSRVYLLDKSIFFQNDIGRDYSVLEDWWRTGKPPLLGPQTNFIPFNHSPVYFYILYPFFVFLDGSPTATAWAAVFYYGLGISAAVFFALSADKQKSLVPIAFFLLVAVGHPQLVISGRYVWNPTFVPLLTFLSLLALHWAIETKRKQSFVWAGLFLGAAAGFNLSVLPLICAVLIAVFCLYRVYILRLCTGIAVGMGALYAPIVAFELRHEWQISRRMLASLGSSTQTGDWFSQATVANIRSIWEYISGTWAIEADIFIACLAVGLYLLARSSERFKYLFWWLIVGSALVFFICIPLKLEFYYFLPLVAALFFAIAVALPRKIQIVLVLLLIGSWGRAWWQGKYISKPLRSASAVYACGAMVCEQLKEPTAVAVTASFHAYHAGPEFQYVLKRSGCQITSVFDSTSTTRTLVVFADQTNFSFPKDSFEEVRAFAPTTTDSIIQCPEGITAHVLRR